MRTFLAVVALLFGLSVSSYAQEWEATNLNTWVNGTGFVSNPQRLILASRSDTTEMNAIEDFSDDDTLLEMVAYVASGDTAQASFSVDYFAGTKYVGSSVLDSLVYGFNTDKRVPVASINVKQQRPVGATHFKGRTTQSATYNKNGTAARLGFSIIYK